MNIEGLIGEIIRRYPGDIIYPYSRYAVLPECEYCWSRAGESLFHSGTCANCGAPLPYVHDLEMSRDAFPNDPYYKDGGVSMLSSPEFYTVWGAGGKI